MDTLDHYHQQYLSFNMNKTILEHYRDRKSMMPEVWAFLVDQAYANGHFELYKKLFDDADTEMLKGNRTFDKSWYEDKKNQFNTELAKKQSQLSNDVKSGIKPSIQASHLAIAKLHINSGSYSDFEFSVLKAHDTAPGNPDVVLFLKIAALYSNKFDDAKYIISKYEDNTVLTNFQVDNKPLYIYARAIQGLVSLKYRDYYYALNSFLEINPEVVPYLGLFTSLADLARYIVILAVIYLRRDEIKTKLFNGYAKQIINQSHHASKFIDNYLNANYEDMMINLNNLLLVWDNDRYVHGTRSTIYDNILERATRQFLLPLKKVKLENVATSFNISSSYAEDIVKTLILTNQIKAKIDKVNKLIISKESEELTREYLVKKASNIVGNYCFDKQYAVLKVGFNVLANARHKNKSVFEQND